MRLETLFQEQNLTAFFESALPDFVLSFAFFTSIVYAALGKKFDRQRSAVMISVSVGMALSFGLIWWEQSTGFSIKNLGPIAIGFAILFLAIIMYQCIRHVGGSWAGLGITIGVSLLIFRLLGFNIPIDSGVIHTITGAALIVGLIAFLSYTGQHSIHFPQASTYLQGIHHDMSDLYQGRRLSNRLTCKMKKLRGQTDTLYEHPEEAVDVLVQLKKMLPAEGYLTEKMSQLQAKAHRIRQGHVNQLEETRKVFAKLPKSAKKKASADLAARYNQLIGIDTRLERLNKAVTENERRIRELISMAQRYTANYDFQKLTILLKAAEKLQHHNDKLFKIINRTENKLSAITKKVVQETEKVNNK